MTFVRSSSASGRLLIAAGVSAALMMTAVGSSLAAPVPQQPGATVVGTVTCGPAEEAPAPSAVVAVAGSDLTAVADSSGRFTLSQVPTDQLLTIVALSDPFGTAVSSRPNVSLQPGQTLDIGNLDLTICPIPAPAAPTIDQVPVDISQIAQP